MGGATWFAVSRHGVKLLKNMQKKMQNPNQSNVDGRGGKEGYNL